MTAAVKKGNVAWPLSMSDVSSVPSRPTTPLVLEPAAAARPYRFVWDPAQRRPGPESVSGTTEGRAGDDFGDVPAPFNFLNPSSLSLALGTLPAQWSSSRTGFHGQHDSGAVAIMANDEQPSRPSSTIHINVRRHRKPTLLFHR